MKFHAGQAMLSVFVFATNAVLAQEPPTPAAPSPTAPGATQIETWTGPVPETRVPPEYPPFAVADGLEGWVALSYIVSKDGGVTDLMIEDSSGDESFEHAAAKAVAQWHFAPATRNGEPIDHPMTRTVLRFTLEKPSEDSADRSSQGAGREFVRAFKQISTLVDAGNVQKAQEALAELSSEKRRNLYEDAWFWWLRYNVLIAAKTTDRAELLTCLDRAVGHDIEYLPPDLFLAAAARLVMLRAQDGDFGGALTTYEQLTSSKTAKSAKDYEHTVGILDENMQKVRNLISGPAILQASALVGRNDYWVHTLTRHSFALSDIRGDLQAVEVRCQHQSRSYTPVTDQHTWTVPASWEKCGVYIHGTPGATFKFSEYPDRG